MNNQKPTSSSRREELRRKQAAAASRSKTARIAWIGGLVVVVALIAVIAVSFWPKGATTTETTGAAASAEGGPIVIGDASAAVTVDIYTDFMCPYCGRFEQANGEELQTALDAGTAKLAIHPMSFLDQASNGSQYSTRAANAFVTLAQEDTNIAWKFNRLLFANQPAEGSSGLSDEQLKELAVQAGASEQLAASITKLSYRSWVEAATQAAFDSGVQGTPTVKVNGTVFSGDLYTAGPLTQAIADAAKASANAEN